MQLLPDGEMIMSFCDEDNIKHYPCERITIEGIGSFGMRCAKNALEPIPVHIHSDYYEIYYVTRGSLTLTAGNSTFTLNGGDAAIIRPGELHSTGEHPITIHKGYYFQLKKTGNLLGLGSEWSNSLLLRLSHTHNRIFHPGKDFSEQFDTALSGSISQNAYRRFSACSALLEFFYAVFESETSDTKTVVSREISNAQKYIDTHVREKLSVDSTAAACGMSVSSFKHRFRNETGFSPMEYINRRRIDEAKSLLAQGWSVTDTAYELDFTSSSYFSVVFKKITSMTASQYCEKYNNTGRESII